MNWNDCHTKQGHDDDDDEICKVSMWRLESLLVCTFSYWN